MAARMRLAQRQGLLPPHLYPGLPPLPPLFSPYYHTSIHHPPPSTGHPHHSQAVPPHLTASLNTHDSFTTQHHDQT